MGTSESLYKIFKDIFPFVSTTPVNASMNVDGVCEDGEKLDIRGRCRLIH